MLFVGTLYEPLFTIGKISGDSGYDTVSTITGVTSAQTDTTTGMYTPHIITVDGVYRASRSSSTIN